jgi:hypothetical protein
MARCDKCGGIGVIEKEGRLYECLCAYLRRRASEMAPYIRKARVDLKHLELPIINATNQSLYIISSWADMKAIIKAVMIKNPRKYIRITSDREVRDVFVGATSRAAKGEEEQAGVFNTLQDLMDLPDLVIVRLNEMQYKNKAAPGALLEAVSFRLDRDKPTWILSDSGRPFTSTSYAWSEAAVELFGTGFIKMVVPPILPKAIIEGSFMADLLPSQTSPSLFEGSKTAKVPQATSDWKGQGKAKERPRKGTSEPPADESPLSIYGSGLAKPTGRW